MDANHRIDAPDEEELKNIEQVEDRSGLSTLYATANPPWEGDLVSKEERERRRQAKEDTMNFGIRKEFLTIGLFIPLPFMLAILAVIIIFMLVNEANVSMFIIPAIFGFLFWALISFGLMKKVSSLFYANALQAGPFVVALMALLITSAYIIYTISIPFHNNSALTAGIFVGSLTVIWSVILSFGLLRIWTTPKLKGNVKFGIVISACLALLAVAVYFTFFV